jgi:integrase
MKMTIKRIEKLSPGKHADGQGLYCLVTPSGGRSWALRYERHGRERWHGLGPCRIFKPEEARQRARKAKQMLFDGIDPIDAARERRTAEARKVAKTITFENAARKYVDQHKVEWSSAKHAHQFTASLKQYAFPVIGKLPVAEIDTDLIYEIIEPIWLSQYQTASRVRGRIASVLDWATAHGYRSGDNPARWQGNLKEKLPNKGDFKKAVHHEAMPYAEVSAFLAELAGYQGVAPRALEFLILTAARSNEVMSARWSEIDLAKRVWTIPEEKMKGREEHDVPLTDRMIALLKALPRDPGADGLVFIGTKAGTPLAKNTLGKLLTRVMKKDCTVHGFRSSFRTWAAESTSYPRDVIESALAHLVGTAVERAYQRSKLLAKRRPLMEAWSRYVSSPARRDDASVTPIRQSAKI